MPHVRGTGGVAGFKGADAIAGEDFWDVDCEILIPAALEGQIQPDRARRLKARLVLEGANGPTLPSADDILADRGVLVVPDVICNAGGVTVSYFEWVQDISSFFWSEAEINQRLDRIMAEAFNAIWEVAHISMIYGVKGTKRTERGETSHGKAQAFAAFCVGFSQLFIVRPQIHLSLAKGC